MTLVLMADQVDQPLVSITMVVAVVVALVG
jgi:hypothetical protein